MQRGLGEAAPPKGVPPMSDCRGFPHERLHQDNQSTYLPLCKKPTLVRMGRWGDGEMGRRESYLLYQKLV
ncbi:MAG: hypothetical protein F6J98_17560 [Moorea sp. SIO4G2]|nr:MULTISPECIES: hypothetical protein [unclassified Moorena]NEO25116.1 hypothetical protein [Moorena sp. SIO4A5]NEO49634.1 hypothetical protein [Moorena sp. SIO4A3]NEO62144.1 hypothetical protein [Moorena sp. SIO4G2]